MISIDCSHPDLEEFINLKSDLNICTKANISVRVSDEFMRAVVNDTDWVLHFDTDTEHIEKTVKAKDIMMLLARRNWEMAEPGVLFWDSIKRYNMLSEDSNFKFAGVNPCAEEPLPAGGSCLLGSINLSEFVKNPFTRNCYIDYESLEEAITVAVKGLNQVLMEGMSLHPLEVQRKSVYDWRQIGLGTFGLGDMLIKMRLKYGSQESIDLMENLFKFIATTAVETSLQLAKTEGCYPMCNKDALAESRFIQDLKLPENVVRDIKTYGLFNSQLLTCAPTGTIGTMLGISTGVEPNYAFSFTRRTVSLNKEETYYKVDANIVKEYRMINKDGELPEYFVSSKEIPWQERVAVQAVLQRYTDASISSTVNLPESATVEDVFDLYIKAWLSGLKGITIWRDNCQRQGILSEKPKESKPEESSLKRGEIIRPGDHWLGLKRTLVTGCGTLHVTAYFDRSNGELRECYLSKGSTGGCNNFMVGLSRMISLSARGGISIEAILDQLKSCGVCPSYAVRSATKKDTSKGSCCPVAVGNALKEMYEEMKTINSHSKPDNVLRVTVAKETFEECPSCHEKTLSHQGGCLQCTSCGYSKCN